MKHTQQQFKKIYHKALGEFKNDGNTLEESCNLSKDWIKTSESKFKDILRTMSKNGKEVSGKKSELYQKMLYELDPDNLIEVFFIGHLIGTFEGWSAKKEVLSEDDEVSELKLHMLALASKIHFEVLDKTDDEQELYRLRKNFRKLLESTLLSKGGE
tara:strand:- start:196 stop:666 length:471 start_codon:yes stop_codon:yes gene_type:complete